MGICVQVQPAVPQEMRCAGPYTYFLDCTFHILLVEIEVGTWQENGKGINCLVGQGTCFLSRNKPLPQNPGTKMTHNSERRVQV